MYNLRRHLSLPITTLPFPAASLANMEKNVAASLTSLFGDASNGRRLNAKEGELVDKASGFLSSAIAMISDASTHAIEKLEGLTGDALDDALAHFTNDLIVENSWDSTEAGKIVGDGEFIARIKAAETLAEAQIIYEEYEDAFCIPAEINTDFGEKVPTKCEGPTIRLEYEPKECIVSDEDHSITCKPGKLLLRKYPGKCVMKHHRPFEFIGKECVGITEFSKKPDDIIIEGGEEYTLWFEQSDFELKNMFHKEDKEEHEAAA